MNVAALAIAAALAVGAPAAAPAAAASPAAAAPDCTVTDATMTWGFKESFRSYISGTIANGEWTVADGTTYETPDFGWANGTGQISDGVGQIAFTGSIEFTGHGGILDTTVTNPRLVLDGSSRATLLLDVSGTTQQGADVDEKAVPFASVDISGAEFGDGTVTITAAPAVLTEAGSAAFGTYEAGEALDPITAQLSADPACTIAPVGGPGLAGAIWLGIGSVLAIVVITVELVLWRRRSAQEPGA
ncbi:MAG TPA: HtaA domain-containing protein [Rhodoglobus sp.]|nr:HtaA domain-containing protein [Rhodoglobus sp.]